MQLQSSNLLAPDAAQCSPCKRAAMAQLGTGKRALAQMIKCCWQALLARRGVRPAHRRLAGRASPLGLCPADITTTRAFSKVSSHWVPILPGTTKGPKVIVNARQGPAAEQPQQRRQPGQQAWSIQQSS